MRLRFMGLQRVEQFYSVTGTGTGTVALIKYTFHIGVGTGFCNVCGKKVYSDIVECAFYKYLKNINY